MGLADFLNDPQVLAGLTMLSQSRDPNTSGQAVPNGIAQMLAMKQAEQQKAMQEQQMQLHRMQLQRMQQQQSDEAAQRDFYSQAGNYMQSPQQQAIGMGGPSPQAAAMIPNLQPQFDKRAMLADMLKVPGLQQHALAGMTKEDEPIKLGMQERLINKQGKELVPAQQKETLPWYVRRGPNGEAMIDPAYAEFEKMRAREGRPPSPFFQAVPTTQGMMTFDARTGSFKPASIGGAPIIKPTDDPALQGKIAEEKKLGQEMGEQRSMLQGKQEALSSVSEAKKMLSDGIYSGAYANLKLTGAKVIPGIDTSKAARTEEFKSHIGNVVIPRLKEFGGNDSNEELRYLQKVMGGEITMEGAALGKILESTEAKIKRGINALKSRGNTDKADPLGIRK